MEFHIPYLGAETRTVVKLISERFIRIKAAYKPVNICDVFEPESCIIIYI